MSGCIVGTIARTAVDVVTLPVKAVSAGVDAATTSQAEADEKRGREIRKAGGSAAASSCGCAEERCRKGRPLPTDNCAAVAAALMRYFLDTEYNGWGGALLSLALVPDDGEELYLTLDWSGPLEEWVERHVVPYLDTVPESLVSPRMSRADAARAISPLSRRRSASR